MSRVGDRLGAAVRGWHAREITSGRMLATAIGLLGLLVPVSLFSVVTAPTTGDRFAALAFAALCAVLGLYSLWEAKAPIHAQRRPRRRDRDL